ncbi:MAG: hypothetical protein ACI9R3_005550 [Verrucomicrobiales bacterium]|jgi:hypothetical protein
MHTTRTAVKRGSNAVHSAAVLHLQSEITETRIRMEKTMKKLSKKLDGAKDAVEWADHCLLDWENGAGKVARHMKRHPIPYTVAGIGIGWVIFRAIMDREEETLTERLGDAASDAGEKISHAAHVITDEAKDTVGAVRGIVEEAADDVAKRARKTAGQVAESAREAKQRVKSEVRENTEKLRHTVDENQLAIGAGLLAAGVIAGLLLPRTRKEDQWLGTSRDHLKDSLKESGREALEKGRDLVHDTVEAARARVEDVADNGQPNSR